MKEILAKDLQVGDVFIDGVRLSTIAPPRKILLSYWLQAKCIMSPTEFKYNKGINIGDLYHLPLSNRVELLGREGEVV